MTVAWELSPPWDWLAIIGILAVVSGPVFWLSLSGYHRRYFPGKAVRLAIWRTIGWLIWYGGSFALVFWLSTLLWPAGWGRYLVGSVAWWLLSETILPFGWEFLERVWEML